MGKLTLETSFVIPGEPMAAPRQVHSDRWNVRPRVARYRTWCELARLHAPKNLTSTPQKVVIKAYFSIPASWPEKKKKAMSWAPHRSKPDADNIIKAVLDALWKQDSCVSFVSCLKLWDDGQ